MEYSIIAMGAIISVVAVALFSKRLGVAAPLLLVLAGAAIGTLPQISVADIDPEWILGGILPPILYAAAINMPNVDFRRNLKPITGLAVLLVVVSTGAGAVLFHLLIPEIGWPAAFALAAVLSPTDAVAATSVGRRLGLPSRLLAILEGEGLVNDATALVLLRSAVAAMGAGVSAGGIIGDFVLAVIGAVAVGALVGAVNVRVRRQITDPVINTAISFVVPFVAFIPAEELGFSGILAVVVTGLLTSDLAARHLRAEDRLTEETNWKTISFLLEGLIFLLMGISLEDILDYAGEQGISLGEAFAFGLLATVLLIAVRIVFVVPLVAYIRRDDRRLAVKSRTRSRGGDPTLGWRGGGVIAWAGMRGAVTVAAAQTLPLETPYRAELLLIAYVGALVTLLLQGGTIPWVIRKLDVRGDDRAELKSQYVALIGELSDAASAELERRRAERQIDPALIERVTADSMIHRSGRFAADDDLVWSRARYIELRLAVLRAERDRMLRHMSSGTYSAEVIDRAQHLLDLEEARLEQVADAARD